MSWRNLFLLFACTGLLSISSCHKQNKNEIRLAFVTNNSSDYWTYARAGVDKAVSELTDVKVDFEIPDDGTAGTQKRIVDDLLSRGVQGIAISPVDPKNEISMLNDASKQTLVFTQDSDAPTSSRACYVGTDNVAAGQQAGELVKQALPDGGKIMIFVGTLDAANAHDRLEGLKAALKGSKISIIDTRTDDTDRSRAKSNVADAITKYPDLAGCVGLWSYNGPAIIEAVKAAGKGGQIKIVCFDEEAATMSGVQDGTVFATVVQQPYVFGHDAVTIMAKYLRGDKSAIPANKQIFIPTLAITKDKVDSYRAKLKELRGH